MNDGGEPQIVTEKSAPSPWAMFGAVIAVLVSSVIAFFTTCFPAGYIIAMSGNLYFGEQATAEQRIHSERMFYLACGIGVVAAMIVGYLVARAFRRYWNNQ